VYPNAIPSLKHLAGPWRIGCAEGGVMPFRLLEMVALGVD